MTVVNSFVVFIQLSSDLNNAPSEEALSEDFDLLCQCGVGQYMEGWLLDTLHMNLTSTVVPEFWTGLKLQDGEEVQERERARILSQAFRSLLTRLEPLLGEIVVLPLVRLRALIYLFWYTI